MAKKQLKLVLANGTEIPVHDMLSVMEPHVIAKYLNQEELDAALTQIAEGNLGIITIKKGSIIMLIYEDCVLEGYQVHYEMDGTLSVHFYFRDNAHGLQDEEDEEEEDEP